VAGIEPTSVETASAAADCRCLCGNLLARLVEGGVEVKCRRCKRTLVLPIEPPEKTPPSRATPMRAVRRAL